MAVFWVVAPCSLVEVYQRFRGPCCLHHQGGKPWWWRQKGTTVNYKQTEIDIVSQNKDIAFRSYAIYNASSDFGIIIWSSAYNIIRITLLNNDNFPTCLVRLWNSLLLWQANIDYKCLKLKCSGSHLSQRRMSKWEMYVWYYMTRNFGN
jgi:hypothetical protein